MEVASLSPPLESSMPFDNIDNNLNEVDKFNLKRQERIRASREEAARLKNMEESKYKAQQDADKRKKSALAKKISDSGDDLKHVSETRQNGVVEEKAEKKATKKAIIVGDNGDGTHQKDDALATNEKGVSTKNTLDKVEPSQTRTSSHLPSSKEEAGSIRSEEEKRIRGREEFLKRRDDISANANDESSVAKSVSSRSIRKLRKKQEMIELGLRQQLNSMSGKSEDSDSFTSRSFETMDSSLRSFKSLQSARSMNTSKSKRAAAESKSLNWEDQYVEFSFSLLTAHYETPEPGQYNSVGSEGKTNLPDSEILEGIMSKVMSLSKAIIEQRSGNVIMMCQKTFIVSVELDGNWHRPNRPGVLRSLVKAAIVVRLADLHQQKASTASKIVSRVLIHKTLSEAVENGAFDRYSNARHGYFNH